jgi:hypothetical protein
MPRILPALVTALSIASPPFGLAQTAAPGVALTPTQTALACAPPPAFVEGRRPALRVAGAQDTVARSAFDDHDLLIVNGGSSADVRVGQEFFVRRPFSAPNYANRFDVRHPIHTAGWVRIVATNDGTSIALVEHACGSIQTGDYLEPFTAPVIPADVRVSDNPADLDFGSMGRVMYGEDERSVIAPGEFLLIDRGAGQGISAGAHFAVYRDVKEFVPYAGRMRSAHLPLAAIGEAVVVASGPSAAVVQLIAARDAVQAGDFVVPRRQ